MSDHTPRNNVRLAVAQQARREAIYDARVAQGENLPAPPRVPSFPPARGKLPSLDELVAGPEAPKARWKLALAVGSAIVGLAELVRQVAALVK